MGGISNILVCGAGMMGKNIALVFSASSDHSITLYDVRGEGVLDAIRANLQQLADNQLIPAADIEARLSRIRFTTDSSDACFKEAQIVVECVFEDMRLKQDLFSELEEKCSANTIFATNTSVMSPTEISKRLTHKGRFVGTHFWNPAHLIPLVEVVKSSETTDEVANTTLALLNKVGKVAVLCKKDVPGFIANRMQHALWREAISIVEQGIADARTVDLAVKNSFGLRLPQLGPLENADMVGLDLTYSIHSYILKHLEDSHEPSPLLKNLQEEGKLGFKSGEGFLPWTQQQKEAAASELSQYLIYMTNFLKEK